MWKREKQSKFLYQNSFHNMMHDKMKIKKKNPIL